MIGRLALASLALTLTAPAAAQSGPPSPPAKPNLSHPAFEFFRLAPGKTEDFIRSVAIWDQVNAAGGQPKTELYLHEDGEGWDVMLYKPPRATPTAAQVAAMDAKRRELGLLTGPLYFVELRQKMADHAHFVAVGPMYAENWVKEIDAQRAEKAGRK